jgi:tetratricopeptide (TPR) repeat protein
MMQTKLHENSQEFQGPQPHKPYFLADHKLYTEDQPEGLDPTDQSLNIKKVHEKENTFWSEQCYEGMGAVIQPVSKETLYQGISTIKHGSSDLANHHENCQKVYADPAKYKEFLQKQKFKSFRMALDIAFIHYRAFMYKEALEWIDEAEFDGKSLTINQETAGSFEMLYNIKGDILSNMKKFEEGERYLDKSHEITKAYFKNYRNHFALTNANMAELYYLTERYEESEALWKDVKKIVKAEESVGNMAAVNFQRTQLNLYRNEIEKAKNYLKKSVAAATQLKGDPYNYYMGRILRNQGWISFEEGKKTEAESLYKEALSMLRKNLPEGNELSELYKKEYQDRFGTANFESISKSN